MTREEILTAADERISGIREKQYGKAEDSFGTIAELWTTYLSAKRTRDLGEFDVCAMLMLFKIARLSGPQPTDDSLVDICGYAAIAAEMMGENE